MKAIDRLYSHLKQNENEQLTTSEIANLEGLSRNVVSSYLSSLYKKGLVDKKGTRPIYWQVNKKDKIFSDIIGYDGSLKSDFQAILESILYPPNGLPILITGPSGSGKSMLARKIYEKSIELKRIKRDGKFVTLNAADYANNAELLSSVLFGHKKGAYTGAEYDSNGLLDKANNGYLFLDEVHRLSKTNQEKLFSVLDNGSFYPLGEVNKPHYVNVRLILATTEDVHKYLLKTFLRRIPLYINLPSFIERPYIERIAVVTHCFKDEAQQTDRSYKIAQNKIIELSNTDYSGNIGTLENKIKILCAQGFTSYSQNTTIPIGNIGYDKTAIVIDKNFTTDNLNLFTNKIFSSFQDIQKELIKALLQKRNISDCKLIVLQHLRLLSHFINKKSVNSFKTNVRQEVKSVLEDTYGIKLGLSNNEISQFSFACGLSSFQDRPLDDTKKLLALIQQKYPRSFYLYKKFLQKLHLTIVDSYYLWFFLLLANVTNKVENIPYTCILVAHGNSTATSIQKVVNNLVGNYLFEAFDMPINATVADINKHVNSYIALQRAHDNGIILLFDMGSLNQMFVEIKHSSNKQLLVINNLTTITALDIAIRVQRLDSFNEIAKKAAHYGTYTGVQYFEGLSNKDNIIISCLSGSGLSVAFKNILEETLSSKMQIFTMDYHKLRQLLDGHNQKFFKNTKLIITTTDFNSDFDLPVFNIYNILDKRGFDELKSYLLSLGEKNANVDNLLEKFLKFLTIEGIKNRLEFLNPNVVISEVQNIGKRYQNYYNSTFSGKIKLNLYMHLALMIERVLLNKNDNNSTKINFQSEKEKEFFSVSKTIFKPVEIKYNIKVNDFEISLIYELLKDLI